MPSQSHTVKGLTITPILRDFGAEVSGVDWDVCPLPEDVIKTLTTLQNQYAVMIFRHTNLDNDRQVSFSAQMGELEENPVWGGGQRFGSKWLFDVSNLELDGSVVKEGTRRWHHSLGNALWHTDSSFCQHRSKYSLLLAHSVPAPGQADTHFADTRAAWRDIPEERKEYLRDIVVEHELWHSRRLASPEAYVELTPEEKNKKPPAFHRLVQTAPNGQETFFLAAHAKTLYKNGKPLPDSQKLIWELIEHCGQPKYVFTAEWKEAGTMMWWDNRQSMHRASAYTSGMGPRDVRRATVSDDGPSAFGISKEEIATLEK